MDVGDDPRRIPASHFVVENFRIKAQNTRDVFTKLRVKKVTRQSNEGDVGRLQPIGTSSEYLTSGFPEIATHLDHGPKHNILDLGAAVGTNVEYFSQFNCQLRIEDLFQNVSSLNTAAAQGIGWATEQARRLFSYGDDMRFDVVLAWDLFNYLEPVALQALMSYLSRFCQSGTLLFVLVYTRKEMAKEPINFTIIDQATITLKQASGEQRPCPQYTLGELQKRLPGFKVVRAFLLQNGMQEFVLSYEGTQPL